MKTFLMPAIALSSFSASAAQVVNCIGENTRERLQFVMESPRSLTITRATKDLCAGYLSIATKDEAANLELTKSKLPGMKTYDLWDGNWGFTLDLPNAVVAGRAAHKTRFKVRYHFVYNDIDEAELDRTLVCELR